MTTPISRRQFLRGKLKAQHSVVRPPRAINERAFLECCTRCGDCIRACEEGIIQSDSGFPYLVFTDSGCTFCDDCTLACKSGALVYSDIPLQWPFMASLDDALCLSNQGIVCQICQEQCDSGAIKLSLTASAVPKPELDADSCTACGFCVATCPGKAISIQLIQPYSKPQEDTQCMSQA